MRAIIQRVSQASVTIEKTCCGSIQKGLLVFVGIESTDDQEDIEWLTKKIVEMRIFSDENGKMNRSIKEVEGRILIISQFTLHAKTKKGNRPSFIHAAHPDVAIPLYEAFISDMKQHLPGSVETGKFGADMKVQLINDGPVTIWIDTKNKE